MKDAPTDRMNKFLKHGLFYFLFLSTEANTGISHYSKTIQESL